MYLLNLFAMKNKIHKKAFISWLAIYPLISFIFLLFGDFLLRVPIFIRTFILTIILVPALTYVILPFYYKIFDKWLNR